MLAELKYTFDIVNETMDFSPYKVLILPDDIPVTEVLKEKLKKHLECGRGIIASAKSGLDTEGKKFAMEEWGVEYKGTDPSNQPYFKMTDTSNEILGDMRWAMYDPGIIMDAKEGTEVLAEHIDSYFNRHRDAERGYFYTPPAKANGHAAITRHKNVYHIAFEIFHTYYTGAMLGHKEVVKQMLDTLLPDSLIKADELPRTSRVTITEKDDMRIVHVKVTYPEKHGDTEVIQDHNALPAGKKIKIKGEYTKAVLAPTEEKVMTKIVDGYTEITLPEIFGYAMIVLKK